MSLVGLFQHAPVFRSIVIYRGPVARSSTNCVVRCSKQPDSLLVRQMTFTLKEKLIIHVTSLIFRLQVFFLCTHVE
jgi:hypothetical protein